MNIITFSELLKQLNCSESTLRTYLDRFEFSHIKHYRIQNKSIYKGITTRDKIRLKELITNSKKKEGENINNGSKNG